MQETGCRNVGEYLEAIAKNREVRLRFECLMTVSISRFFRDLGLWQHIQAGILPLWAETGRAVKVWSAGCASGEEVYSFKILWESLRENHARLPDLRILATDLCSEYLQRAKAAVYPPGSMREVPEATRSACFEKREGGMYALKPRIKGGIEWRVHDLLSDPPGTSFDLVFLRNTLLTYYKDEIKIPALRKVVAGLAPEGFLILGSHEKLPVETGDLKPWGECADIFQKPP
jgi:chemotaxis protein methyltransferase CheR